MATINERITEEIRATAGQLLREGSVAAVIGYRAGSLPMMTRPVVVRREEDCATLVWNSFCVLNLANYLPQVLKSLEPARGPRDPKPEGPLPRVAVLATGCWSRNIAVQVQEHQVERERVVVLGIGSRGMVSRHKLEGLLDGREILAIEESDHELVVRGRDFTQTVNRWQVVRDNCQTCTHPDPGLLDLRIGAPVSARKNPAPYRQVEEIEALASDDRWAWFQSEFASCIRCYACRNACPLCYCPTCFVDDAKPQWVGKSLDATDTALFHILRAYHCAGRCTDCGACESVCPMGINMRLLTKKLNKDVEQMFGFRAGETMDAPLPLTTCSAADPQQFLVNQGPGLKGELP